MEALIIKCVTKSIPVNNDLLYLSKRSYDGEIERVKALLNDAGTNEIGSSSRILQLNTAVLGTLSIDEKKRYLSSYQHENYMFQLQHCRKCQCVTMYKINAVTDPNTSYYCSYCDKKPKDILKIEHYFIRFEFADGRGEIHGTSVVCLDYCNIITKPGSWFNGVYIIQLIS